MGANANQNGTTGNQKLYGTQTNSSSLGNPVTVVIGTRKVSQQIFWQDGFQANSLSKKQAGGKGGGKSGQFNYSADVIAGLCCGPVSGIGDAWSGQSFLGQLQAAEEFSITRESFTFTPTNASSAVNNYGVTPTANVTGTFNDFSAPNPTEVSATTSTPFTKVPVGTTPGQGEYTYNPSTGVYTFSPDDAGKTVTAAYSFLLTTINQQETDIIPSTLTIDVQPEFPFNADLGVVFSSPTASNNGQALQRVSGTPTAEGTYSVSGSGPAVYRFAAADEGAEVTITFQINDTGAVGQGESTLLDFTLATGEIGQAPYSFLTGSFPQAAISYTGIATVLYEPMDLGPSAEIQQNNFEVVTPDIFGGVYATTNLPILDCNPVTCILRVLTDTQWGMGVGAIPFPTSFIDNGAGGTWGSPGTPSVQQSGATAYNWFAANSFFISALLNSQDTASSTMAKWLESGLCAAYVSEGLLKLVPYGDTTVAGNGCTWVAPSQAVVSLDDTNFISKEGDEPVQVERSDWQDAWNGVQVTFTNRQAQYGSETIEETDQGLINRFGSRLEDPQSWDHICALPAATFAANVRLKRFGYIRNKYTFTLPFNFSFLEPQDIVELTTSSVWAQGANNENLGIVNLPVRIQKVTDDPVEGIKIEAEDYPFGVGAATLFNKGTNTAETINNSALASPGTAEVVLFEAAGRAVGFAGNQIWMGACGTSSSYGGTNVFASQDNVEFVQVAQLKQISVLGELAAALPVGSDPDTTDSLVVELAENSAGLVSATQQAANNDTTLCYVDGEYISFSTAALTGQNTWTMDSYLRRGQLGSAITAHAIGGLFLRLDSTIVKYTYDPTWNGKQVFFKLQPYNTSGQNATPLSSLQSIALTLSSTNSGTIDASSGLIEQTSVDGLTTTIEGINNTISTISSTGTSTATAISELNSTSFLTPSDQIALLQQLNAVLATQTSLDATAKSLGISSAQYDASITAISTELIDAGAPSNFLTTWPMTTVFGPVTGIQTNLSNLFAEVSAQQTAIQTEISSANAEAAQIAAVAQAIAAAPTVVTTLPTLPSTSFPAGRYVFDSTNNELFVVNSAGNAFTNLTVPAASISGTLAAAQVASLAASQITGQLTAAQIASLAATQITGQLTASQIASLAATQITGQLSASQIAEVNAASVAGQLTAGQIASVSATTVTGELTAGQIASVQAASLIGAVGSGNICANGDFMFTEAAAGQGAATGTIPINFECYNNANIPITSSVQAGGAIGTANFWRIQALATTTSTFGFFIEAGPSFGGFQDNLNYVISFYARGAAAAEIAGHTFTTAFNDPPPTATFLENPVLTTSFQRYAVLVNFGTATVDPDIFFNIGNGSWAAGTELDVSNVQVQQGDSLTGWAPPAITAANPISPITASTFIGAGSISTGQIAANSITAGQLAANSVTAASIEAGSITATQIATSTLTSAQIAAGSIVGSSIAAGTISSSNIQAGAITTSLLAADSVTTANLVVSGNGAALNADPNCNDITAFISSAAAIVVNVADNAPGQVGDTALQCTCPAGGDVPTVTGPIQLAFGKSYRVTCLLRTLTGSSPVFIRCFTYPGSVTQTKTLVAGFTGFSLGLESQTVPTGWTRYTATVTPASGVTWCVLDIEISGSTETVLQIQDWRIEEQVPGSLVVDGAITATQIAASTITGGNIAASTITGANLVAGTITASEIAASTITATQIAAGTITGANLVAGTITASEIAAATITGTNIAAATITASNLVANTITAGQLAANSVTAASIEAGTITSAQIAAGSIQASNIASATITGGQIAANTITGTNIAAGTITANNIESATITGGLIAAGTIEAGNIAAGSITTGLISAGGISANVLTSGTINAADINVTNINADNITVGTLDATQVVFSDGSSLNTASRVIVAKSTISRAVSVISVDPVETGLGFTCTIEAATDVVNLWATFDLSPFVETVITVLEDDTVIQTTTLAVSQNVFFFSMSDIGAGAHEFRLAIALAATQNSGIQPVLNPSSDGTYMIGQLVF
jgi:hypothetical protein